MARVNVTVPDEVVARARAAGLNISQIATRGPAEELDRRAKLAELHAYLAQLEAGHGPTTEAERAEARRWADQLDGAGPAGAARSA